jgi:uncharacterized membrane protein
LPPREVARSARRSAAILAPRAGLPHDRGMTRQPMSKGRLEAFSDGVIAIIITIMVLELKVPHGADAASLLKVWPVFLSYLLSFLVVAIYWVNHHTLFQAAHHASTGLLWSNNALLFCLSLIPFATGYMGENDFAPFPTALYAATLLLAGVAFIPVRWSVMAQLKDDASFVRVSNMARRKNYVSLGLYAISIPLAFVHPALTLGLAFAVAAIYFLPNAWLGEK